MNETSTSRNTHWVTFTPFKRLKCKPIIPIPFKSTISLNKTKKKFYAKNTDFDLLFIILKNHRSFNFLYFFITKWLRVNNKACTAHPKSEFRLGTLSAHGIHHTKNYRFHSNVKWKLNLIRTSVILN